MTMDPIPMALTTLLSSKCTVHGAITSYVLNAALYKLMYLEASESMIHSHTILECAPSLITNA
jgi:hypothetical protein